MFAASLATFSQPCKRSPNHPRARLPAGTPGALTNNHPGALPGQVKGTDMSNEPNAATTSAGSADAFIASSVARFQRIEQAAIDLSDEIERWDMPQQDEFGEYGPSTCLGRLREWLRS